MLFTLSLKTTHLSTFNVCLWVCGVWMNMLGLQ